MKSNINSLVGFLCAFGIIFLPVRTAANVYTVTNTTDAGPGSLRQAITDANANPGQDTIMFNIATSGNLFEGTASNTYAVIQVNTALPIITSPVYIDGSSQSNTNIGSIAGITTGADNVTLSAIPYPDIYVVPSTTYVFPSSATGVTGNGLTIDIDNVMVKGLAISGFGNTHTNGGIASGHADISILRSFSSRVVNITITNCFFSCDPLGAYPSLANRRSKGSSILINGNNETGIISNNYIAHSGTYGIHFNGNNDNLNIGPVSTTLGNRNWIISGNRLFNISTNASISAITRVSDAITLMKCIAFRVINNYIDDAEQMGVDIGYNSDSNYVSNNTITNFIKTVAFQLQAGLRIGLCSESDTLLKNLVFNNPASTFKGGVWLDKSSLISTGIIAKDNINNLIQENLIHDNNGSGIVLSNYVTGGGVGCYNNTITHNSIYNNIGLGIDLDFNGTNGITTVSVNDDGDIDAGTNNIQNFPIIDSVRKLSDTLYGFYGKAPAGSIMEFFINDGQINKHGGLTLNYGEGKTFIGSAVEGGPQDLRTGTGSYNLDGNVAINNNNLFFVILTYKGIITSLDSVTSTATVAKNTSEFGPVANIMASLDCSIISFSSSFRDNAVRLNWRAICNDNFLYFDVEYSVDGRSFSRLRTINAEELNKITDYEFIHNNPGNGKHYYRLRMVNSNNRTRYSSVICINLNDKSGKGLENLSSFFSNQIDLRVKSDENENIAIHLFNEAGTLVRYTQVSAKPGTNYIQLDNLAQLATGIYFIQLKKAEETLTRKIVKR